LTESELKQITEEEYEMLESEEFNITEDALILMFLALSQTKDNLEKELRAFYQKYGKDGVITFAEARKWVSEQNHQSRINALVLFVGGEFSSVLAKLKPQFKEFLLEVVETEELFFGTKIDADKILSKKWDIDNLNWEKRLEDYTDWWAANIARDLKQATKTGKHVDEVLENLDKRFKTINFNLTSLGLSESTAIGSFSRLQAFKQLGVTKYKFYSKVDERRCEHCGALHGMIFPVTAFEVGVTASPLHRRCRCFEIAIVE